MNLLSGIINVSFIFPGLSKIFLFIDAIIYALLEGAIRITFTIGSLDFGGLTNNLDYLWKNLNTLVGIFIMFKLSLLFIQYLIEPDTFKDKAKGGEAVIKNVVVVLVLLVLLNSGVLFGVLNDIQKVVFGNGSYEILDDLGIEASSSGQNMIEKIVFGGSFGDPAHTLTVKIFEQFLFKYEGEYVSGRGFVALPWDKNKASFNIFDAEAVFGTVAGANFGASFFYLLTVTNLFAALSKVHYTAIISSAFGIYMMIKFINIGLALMLRLFKLFLMQVIAPIAIVSYVTPDGKKTFNNFWKTYFDIYMELFIRLFVAYVSIYIMGTFLNNITTYAVAKNGTMDLITRTILSIVILVSVSKFMDEVPNLISSVFGFKMDNQKQKSVMGILGGVLGGGIGLATGLGSAAAAGAGRFGSAVSGISGMFGGAKAGSSSQNVGAFVSGQISNASTASGKGFDIATAGGGSAYLQQQLDKTFGGGNALRANAQKFKEQAEYHNNTSTNLDAIKAAAEKRHLKDMGYNSKEGWINSQLGEYDQAIERLKNGQSSGMRHQTIDENGVAWEGAEMTMDEVLASREQQAYKLGDKFDDNVDRSMWEKVQNRENMNEEQLGKNAELFQAYDKFNSYETQMAKELGRTPRKITWDAVKRTSTRKSMSDTAKGDAFKAQQEYDKFVNSQRFKNIGGK